jgi:hypothetical protein
MAAWYDSINAFVESAYRLGHFADVPVVSLHSQGFDPARAVFDPVEVGRAGIGDAARKRIILVITDAVGPAWKGQPLQRQLASWAHTHPLAILHVQPHPHWNRSALITRPLNLRSTELGGPNTTFATQIPDVETLVPTEPLPDNCIVIPVMEMSKRWIEQWCRLLNSSNWVRQQVIVLPKEDKVHPHPALAPQSEQAARDAHAPRPPQQSEPPSAEELVVEFLKKALTDTANLTVLLAAAPLNRHTMQLVATHLMPHTGPEHLAEILSSGLVQVVGTRDPGSAPYDRIVFDFLPGVRKQLLARQRDGRKDCFKVAEIIDKYLAKAIPAVEGLAQRIQQLSPPDSLEITEENLPYLEVERDILQARIPRARSDALRRMSDNIEQFKQHSCNAS